MQWTCIDLSHCYLCSLKCNPTAASGKSYLVTTFTNQMRCVSMRLLTGSINWKYQEKENVAFYKLRKAMSLSTFTGRKATSAFSWSAWAVFQSHVSACVGWWISCPTTVAMSTYKHHTSISCLLFAYVGSGWYAERDIPLYNVGSEGENQTTKWRTTLSDSPARLVDVIVFF